MHRLLMIVPFFPPIAGGGVYRPLSFVRYLPRFGWNTVVIAQRGDSFWIRDEGLLGQVPPECEVLRTGTLSGQAVLSRLRRVRGATSSAQKRSSGGFSLARRAASFVLTPDSYLGWYPFAMRAARELTRRTSFDAIYSTSPPETSHLVALALRRHTGLPWVADFRDPWMNLYLFAPPTPAHAAIHRRLERRVCEHAHVLVTTRWHESWMKSRYPHSPSVTRIPNGFDDEEAAVVQDTRPAPDRFRILHAGMLTQQRSALPLLRGLERFLARRPEARGVCDVLFVGAREDRNEQAVREMRLEDVVHFRDSLPHSETLRLERESHILLLVKYSNPVYDGMVPGKLYEYIGARRPILGLVPEGEAKSLIDELHRGETAPLDDPELVANAILRMYDHYAGGSLEHAYDLSPRPEFRRDNLAGDLAHMLDSIAALNPAR
jgi:glycosyltransferase involved in cell wall biosynthesis